MYTNDRAAYRKAFIDVWQKYQTSQALDALESQVIAVILQHPEYHPFLEKVPNTVPLQEFSLEENPFVHMSLHLAIREQVHCDKPEGIAAVHAKLLAKGVAPHPADHVLMQSLAQMLWQAQQTGCMPDDEAYLKNLKTQQEMKET